MIVKAILIAFFVFGKDKMKNKMRCAECDKDIENKVVFLETFEFNMPPLPFCETCSSSIKVRTTKETWLSDFSCPSCETRFVNDDTEKDVFKSSEFICPGCLQRLRVIRISGAYKTFVMEK